MATIPLLLMATTIPPWDNPLYGHPPDRPATPATPVQSDISPPSSWPWWVYLIGILIILAIILVCAGTGACIFTVSAKHRATREAQRLANIETFRTTRAGHWNGTAVCPSAIVRRAASSLRPLSMRLVDASPLPPPLPATAVADAWSVDAELGRGEEGSMWRRSTIAAWVDDIPEGAVADEADLEIRLLQTAQAGLVSSTAVGSHEVNALRVTFAANLPTRESVLVCIARN